MTRACAQLLGPCFKTGRTECREPRDPDAGHPSPRATRHAGTRDNDLRAQLVAAARRPATRATPAAKPEGASNDPSPRRSANASGACNTARRGARPPCPRASGDRTGGRRAPPPPSAPARKRRLNDDDGLAQFRPFASERFHVLLNSLFKVLCNFPSRYLFAIGLALGI